MTARQAVVLASASESRAQILRGAGIDFAIDPAAIDESAIKSKLQGSGASADAVASALADAKALAVTQRHPGARVIGADQMLECGGTWFDKPSDMAEARRHLQTLRGRDHRLITAACVAVDEEIAWRGVSHAQLTMRAFSDRFLDAYLADTGQSVLGSVGAYRIEETGIQLFSCIDGDHFTILGLPLLALLDFLRVEQVVTP